jgi:hypothetical protein
MKQLHTPNGIQEIEDNIEELNSLTAEDNARKETQLAEDNLKKSNQASGNQKLLDLGLSQAEATALTGYTPPVAE